jgi:hypothetical protein
MWPPSKTPPYGLRWLDFWRLRGRDDLRQQFGDDFERHLLMNLGYRRPHLPRLSGAG